MNCCCTGLGLPKDDVTPSHGDGGNSGGGTTDFCWEVRAIYATLRGNAKGWTDRASREQLISALTPVTGVAIFYKAVGWLGPLFASPVGKLGAANVADCLISLRPMQSVRGRAAGLSALPPGSGWGIATIAVLIGAALFAGAKPEWRERR